MGIIFLVRHGEAKTNHTDVLSSEYEGYPLTEHGRAQVEATRDQLRGIKFDEVYSSPVLRARQTAEILMDGKEAGIKVDDRLRERGMGEMEGKPAMKGNWILPMLRKREYSLGVESYESIMERISSFARAVPKDKTILAATHESPVSALACSILGLDEFTGKGIKVGNASVTIIDTSKKGVEMILALGSYSIDKAYFERIIEKTRNKGVL